jgi:hypothetical protein
MVTYRLSTGAMAQLWMSYEIPAPGLGSYLQYLLVGENGMAEFDRDNLRIGIGDTWRDDLRLEPWNWLVDPMAPRRIAMTSKQCDQFARAVERGEKPDITGEDGGDRDGRGGAHVRPDGPRDPHPDRRADPPGDGGGQRQHPLRHDGLARTGSRRPSLTGRGFGLARLRRGSSGVSAGP